MSEIRELPRRTGLSQREFAALLNVPLEAFRVWDSGRRMAPAAALGRASTAVVAQRAHQATLLPLSQLASELGVHVQTLQAAARTGRLDVQFGAKSVFGRPLPLATRAAGEKFIAAYHQKLAGQQASPPVAAPDDYPARVARLPRRLRLTQDGFARRIAAAGKAVVYQWESGKRTPSPVFWERILRLQATGEDLAARRAASRSTSS